MTNPPRVLSPGAGPDTDGRWARGINAMPNVTLNITPDEFQKGMYIVAVSGEGFFASEGAEVGVRIRGADKWFDDPLFSLLLGFPGHIQGGGFIMSDRVSGDALNEDWGDDEVYALVNVEGAGEFRTNTVRGDF